MKVVNFILKWWVDRSWLVNNSLSHWEFTGSMTCFLNLGQLNPFDSTWTIYTTSAKWKIHFFLLLIELRPFSVLFSNTWRETCCFSVCFKSICVITMKAFRPPLFRFLDLGGRPCQHPTAAAAVWHSLAEEEESSHKYSRPELGLFKFSTSIHLQCLQTLIGLPWTQIFHSIAQPILPNCL